MDAEVRQPALGGNQARAPGADRLINVDNGGTLTDICVIDGEKLFRTKTVTTPHDLSECLFDGIRKASLLLYGKEDPLALLATTRCIRYSTTQGTNALVERKGPRLGLVLAGSLAVEDVAAHAGSSELLESLVADRIGRVQDGLPQQAFEDAVVRLVNQLGSAGANRIIIAVGGSDYRELEQALKRLLLRKFPPHLLGAVPILYSHEVSGDSNHARRAWSSLFNAFLHPAMERFLYNADHKLRTFRSQNPLLIFRNDGHSARVARTTAIKTCSSGPRGGMEGARALARHYGFERLLTMDVGGTTTDIGIVEKVDGEHVIRFDRFGRIEGVETSFPLCDVVSAGVGGSSIITANDAGYRVGPESVGSAPGPACFGFGGKDATITDAFLLNGLLDPASYFGGQLRIDPARARAAIASQGAADADPHDVAEAMEAAWVEKVAQSLKAYSVIDGSTTLAAFGGAGPFVACRIAEAVGIRSILIPGLAAVFSAFGIGFSDIAHNFEEPLVAGDLKGNLAVRDRLLALARRAMYAEGYALEDCALHLDIVEGEKLAGLSVAEDAAIAAPGASPDARLRLMAQFQLPQPELAGDFSGKISAAISNTMRKVRINGGWQTLPLYRVEDQASGMGAAGPAVLEEAYFTCRIDAGWRFQINTARDILLTRN